MAEKRIVITSIIWLSKVNVPLVLLSIWIEGRWNNPITITGTQTNLTIQFRLILGRRYRANIYMIQPRQAMFMYHWKMVWHIRTSLQEHRTHFYDVQNIEPGTGRHENQIKWSRFLSKLVVLSFVLYISLWQQEKIWSSRRSILTSTFLFQTSNPIIK